MLTKSKADNVQNLVSEAIIDLEISHKEFKMIMNEKKDYDNQKENTTNKKTRVKVYRLRKKKFVEYYKMVFITTDNYADAGVHTIIVKNKELFWVKLIYVQNGLGLKSIIDLLRKEMYGIFETKNITKEQKRKYIKITKK